MKKSAWFLMGTLIIGMAFGLALAGCPVDGIDNDTGTGTGSGGDPVAAAQLAADINTISAGSATAKGAVVMLSGKLSLENPFTVPVGVTLDLTGEGELALLDVILTVNGTVKAGPQKVRLETSANQGTINGSGTIQLKGQGQLLVVQGNKTLTLAGVTLAGVADNNEPLVEVYSNGAFVMKSGAITGNTHIRSDGYANGGGVRVNGGGTFTMEDGAISGNTVQCGEYANGGGVYIGGNSVFTMEGGTISGNTAKSSKWSGGGGVSVEGNSTFTMQGGVISRNTATVQGSNSSGGGGVRVFDSTFTMEGGAISGNTAESGGWSAGGGVYVEKGTFTLKGGVIYGSGSPPGTDSSLTNIANDPHGSHPAALHLRVNDPPAKWARWGTGGTYTKGGVDQSEGSNIGHTDETLIAIPAN